MLHPSIIAIPGGFVKGKVHFFQNKKFPGLGPPGFETEVFGIRVHSGMYRCGHPPLALARPIYLLLFSLLCDIYTTPVFSIMYITGKSLAPGNKGFLSAPGTGASGSNWLRQITIGHTGVGGPWPFIRADKKLRG